MFLFFCQVDSQDFIFTFSFGAEEAGRLFIFSVPSLPLAKSLLL